MVPPFVLAHNLLVVCLTRRHRLLKHIRVMGHEELVDGNHELFVGARPLTIALVRCLPQNVGVSEGDTEQSCVDLYVYYVCGCIILCKSLPCACADAHKCAC